MYTEKESQGVEEGEDKLIHNPSILSQLMIEDLSGKNLLTSHTFPISLF